MAQHWDGFLSHCSWQLLWYCQGIAGWSVHMIQVNLSRTWKLPGLQKTCYGHLMLPWSDYPGIVGVTDPLNWWIEFSPYWPIVGKLWLPLLFQIGSPGHPTDPLSCHIEHSLAIWLVTLACMRPNTWAFFLFQTVLAAVYIGIFTVKAWVPSWVGFSSMSKD